MISRCKFSKNGFFNAFFPLPDTRPSSLSKIGGNAFDAHFLQLCCKNEYGDPNSYFTFLIRTVLPFNEEKVGINLCSVFWQFYSIVRIYRIACVQIKSTLQRKVKTMALRGIFLVRKWISSTYKSNSVRYHMHH